VYYVRAVNGDSAVWTSPWVRVAVDVSTVPGRIVDLAGTSEPGSGAVQLTWTAPDDGGSPVSRYEVSIDGGGYVRLDDRTAHVDTAGTHTFAVVACNGEGCGAASNVVTLAVTTPPGVVTNPQVTFDDPGAATTTTATWAAPADTGGLALTYAYRYRFSDDVWSEWAASEAGTPLTSGPIAIPAPARVVGGWVQVQVVARNAVGGQSAVAADTGQVAIPAVPTSPGMLIEPTGPRSPISQSPSRRPL
jgi:hypothetical protein